MYLYFSFFLFALFSCSNGQNARLSVSGQITGITVGAGSRVGGRVLEVLVTEGCAIKKGDVLVRLQSDEQTALVAAAKARLDQAEATLLKIENGVRPEELKRIEAAASQAEAQYLMAVRGARTEEIETVRATAEAARAKRDQAKSDYERAKNLYETKVISQQMHEQALHAFEGAESQFKAAMEQLNLVLKGTRDEQIAMAKASWDQIAAALEEARNGARAEDIAAARAARDLAKADLDRAEVVLREMEILAPRDGVAETIDVHAGDLVKPGPVVEITDPEDLELLIYVSALYLGKVGLGDVVEFTTDSHGGETFEGTVVQVATEGEFTPRNLQTQEERVQQVFGVKLKLNSNGGKIRAGMTATAHFDFAHANGH
ncbi:MAG: hypothetical protein AMXMBFR84_13770 [Candidatus Hydrogenedentota bacterium]